MKNIYTLFVFLLLGLLIGNLSMAHAYNVVTDKSGQKVCYVDSKFNSYKSCEDSRKLAETTAAACPKITSSFPNLSLKKLYNHSPEQIEKAYPGLTNFSAGLGLKIFDMIDCVDPVKFPLWKGSAPEETFDECVSKLKVKCADSEQPKNQVKSNGLR